MTPGQPFGKFSWGDLQNSPQKCSLEEIKFECMKITLKNTLG